MSVPVGAPGWRADGLEKVLGQARYTADLALPGMLYARFVYAGRAHARIRRLDLVRARRHPGVLAVIAQDDVPDVRYGNAVADRTLFARGVVRFEGEVVAAVAALTPEAAAAAARLVEVEYEPLEPVLDPERALDPRSPLVHPEWESYESLDGIVRRGNECAYVNIVKGDVEAGLKSAAVVLEERYQVDMSHAVPIEPHAVLAQWQGDQVTIWTTSQVPFLARGGVAETLGIPESRVRIIVPHLGGGFGGKCEFHFEAHVAALARKAGRPVRLVFSRQEEFTAPDKVRHPMVIDLETGVGKDGAIAARRATIHMDSGAYASDAPSIGEVATMMAAGPYRIPHLLIEAHVVYTNRTPAGSVRAPSGPQVCWALEQHTDQLAGRAGIDPVEFRRINLLRDGDGMEAVGAVECLERAARMIGYSPRSEKNLPPPSRGRAGEGVANGVACGWWFSMPAPATAYLKLNADGSATLVTGANENGSGAVMGLALLAAEELGIAPGQVSVLYQDTDAGAFDSGSSGSQTTYNNGRAVILAATEIRERLRALAAEHLEASPGDVVIQDGEAHVKGVPSRSVTVAELAGAAQDNGELLTARGAPLPPPMPDSFGASCAGRVAFPAFADPTFFCHAVRVGVDPQTGVVRVEKVAAAHDFGTVLNPVGAEGQVEGGIVHAIGMALTEGTQYEDGRQLNPHLLDYKLQTAVDAPAIAIEFVETQAAGGPRGAKGVGEPPIVPTAGAIANAIARACGARVRQLPMTAPRVWSALQE
ncbi:MAG: xanthine dehydrogenase family protein molybdopterin-binding subunit [Chloroflexi bacterium]|nr:MAG: xanthine dehydrogenase family protein molybdopterin-binding subunit [Chloroflexota bacterium]